MEERLYGVNTVSMWPWSVGKKGPERSIRIAKKAGYDGIQALPMKDWGYENVNNWRKNVISFEDAWNTGPLWKALLRHLGLTKSQAPTIFDWLVFGKLQAYSYPNAIWCSHEVQYGAVTEIHPGLWKDPQKYVDYCWKENGTLCWDTKHIRRFGKESSNGLNDWRKLLKWIPDKSIKLIHVQAFSKEELNDFLQDKPTELDEMLQALRYKTVAPAIVEVFPPLKTPQGTVRYLKKMLDITKSWLR